MFSGYFRVFVYFIFVSVYLFSIENSIVPIVEQFELLEKLPSEKFTQRQFKKISEALKLKESRIRIVTYNMLYNLHDQDLHEENRWPKRLPRIAELLQEMHADVISTQELYPDQVQDLVKLIGEEYAFYGGQIDPKGESYGIFYRKDRFKLLCGKSVPKLFSMVELKDLKTEKNIMVFNTHMPFSNIEKREMHARALAQIIEPFAMATPVILTGDMNTFPMRLDLPNLPFYDGDYIHQLLSEGSLRESQRHSLLGHLGPISTFTNRDPEIRPFEGRGTPGILLDYIYVSNRVEVLVHAVEQGTVGGHYPSDHMPVFIDLIIR